MTRRNNLLTQPQAVKLYRWLEDHRQFAAGTTAREVAQAAAEELRFGITESNVGTARRALGIHKPEPVKVTACRCSELAAAMALLYRKMGAEPPREVLDIMNGRESPPAAEPLPFPMAGAGVAS